MLNKHQETTEKIREAFYEKGNVLEAAIDKISDFRGEIVEKLGFAPIFVVQQKTERFMPRIDLFDTEDAFQVDIELPGLAADEITLTATSGALRVTGDRCKDAGVKKILFLEQLDGHFSRTLPLEKHVQGANCTATLARGILRVILPKADPDMMESEEFSVPVKEEK